MRFARGFSGLRKTYVQARTARSSRKIRVQNAFCSVLTITFLLITTSSLSILIAEGDQDSTLRRPATPSGECQHAHNRRLW